MRVKILYIHVLTMKCVYDLQGYLDADFIVP